MQLLGQIFLWNYCNCNKKNVDQKHRSNGQYVRSQGFVISSSVTGLCSSVEGSLQQILALLRLQEGRRY
eukprot:UN14595